ncbi:diaminohydroxyphosphoribosylaminopyrimidine deaminase [Chitinophaga costaii]|uniref:Riboflavin biosynthesis protein RibD n=2 Tax=Chitinophaga costaii TaxID=1335309 RepID=A0A1C4D4G5_9BACT|nr:diaminohydroxyphosphoribosylaminopyrimidine deaminase [Chitinophaga costaii]
MERCLQLAQLGAGHVAPNPMVGAVLVHDGRIIGEGYHRQYGQAHAEVNCLASVRPEDRALIPQSTLYVSLEPCAHHGKTPPCADLIVREQIPACVIGCVDIFAKVAGKGIARLEAAGIRVKTGMLERACQELNRRFFTFHGQTRPYVVLKWAQSANGLLGAAGGQPVRISHPVTDRLVHKWRSEEAAILVGTHTALTDNPRLNNRHWTGAQPLRVVIDLHDKVPATHQVYDSLIPTVFVSTRAKAGQDQILINEGAPLLPQLLAQLHARSVQSVLVEGGAFTLQQFIDSGLWDEARVIVGAASIPQGVRAPVLTQASLEQTLPLESDQLFFYRHW